jgi:toxin HigB-1
MIIRFNNAYLQKLFEGKPLGKKPKYREDVILRFKKTVLMLQYAESIAQIRKIKGLNFETLKGDLKGYYSVRVNIQYRLILSVEENDLLTIADIIVIEDLTNHYQ